ncbi:MAG: hypothetical protein KF912_07970 [Phycisphaeraceae bacterium]|nr:hypothetical protein [Phycisphaeraceae bacterium]MBX3367238.1 hypothetical protein [Phycisphaeraceae bacterium]
MTLEQRLDRLETSLRREKRRSLVLTCAVVIMAATALMGLGQPDAQQSGHIRAKSLTIVDADDRPSVMLMPLIGMSLFDKEGVIRLTAGVEDSVARVKLFDKSSAARVVLYADSADSGLGIIGENGKPTALMATVQGEGGRFALFDTLGQQRVTLGIAEGSAALTIDDSTGLSRVMLSGDSDSAGLMMFGSALEPSMLMWTDSEKTQMRLTDWNNSGRADLWIDDAGTWMVMHDKQRHRRASMFATPDDAGVWLFDGNGTNIGRFPSE